MLPFASSGANRSPLLESRRERLSLAGDTPARLKLVQRLEAAFDTRPSGTRVLDVGCGAGRLWCENSWLVQDHEVVLRGLDCDRSSVEKFTRAFGTGGAIHGDARNIVSLFPLGSFDVVTSVNCLQYARPLDAILRGIHRVLAPGGVFLAVIGNPAEGFWKELGWSAALSNAAGWLTRSRGVRRYSAPELERRLHAAGFSDASARHFTIRAAKMALNSLADDRARVTLVGDLLALEERLWEISTPNPADFAEIFVECRRS